MKHKGHTQSMLKRWWLEEGAEWEAWSLGDDGPKKGLKSFK
jgi:hypothetical protein